MQVFSRVCPQMDGSNGGGVKEHWASGGFALAEALLAVNLRK